MSPTLQQYQIPQQLHSSLLLNLSDAVPPTDELEAVHAELGVLRQKALDRARKAENDLKTIEAAMKQMKEKEKGKAKVVNKVKREPSYTPSLDQEERSFSPSTPLASSRLGSAAAGATASAVASPIPKSLIDPRKLKKKDKDKKRKRDDESDGEHEFQRPRKFSPHPPAHKETYQPKPSKLNISTTAKVSTAPDWSLPSHPPLLPARPPVPMPPVAGPSKPIQVTEDFSKAKASTQVPVNTFYSFVEPWLRNIREEDLGLLDYHPDEEEPFLVPKLGRSYLETWEEEDIALYGGVPTILDFSNQRGNQNLPNPFHITSSGYPSKGDIIMESDLVYPERGYGPVTERLLSALLPAPDKAVWKTIEEAELGRELTPIPPGQSMPVPRREKTAVGDFEERVRSTARFHGLLEGEPDFSEVLDDPISTALRQAQRQLRVVIATNKARKARILDVARDRLSYQEYLELRDSIDKSIVSSYTKLQKKDGPKVSKKKKKGDSGVNGNGTVNGVVTPLPNPASSGLGPDEEGKLFVPESLKGMVETRRQWVDVIGGSFEERQRQFPGRTWGFPERSVFEGVEEEVQAQLKVLKKAQCQPQTQTQSRGGSVVSGLESVNGNGRERTLTSSTGGIVGIVVNGANIMD